MSSISENDGHKFNLTKTLNNIGENNRRMLLYFLYQHQYTNISNIVDFLEITERGVYFMVRRLEDEGIIKKVKINENGIRGVFYGLTLSGVYEHCNNERITATEDMVFYESEFNLNTLKHNMYIQKSHIILNNEFKGFTFYNERTYRAYGIELKRKEKNERIPDCLIKFNDSIMALEIEITPKSLTRYNAIMMDYWNDIKNDVYHSVIYAIPKRIFNSLSQNILNAAEKVEQKIPYSKGDFKDKIQFIEI